MSNKSPIAIFLAATSALAITATETNSIKAEPDLGGTKEWNTDMPIGADYILDEKAKLEAEEAKANNLCIPIGEGENCW